MLELYIAGGAAIVIGFLWMRNKILKKERDAQKVRAETAENIASHNAAIAQTERKRNEGKTERIEEAVDYAIDTDFGDFYDDDDL